MSLNTSLSGQTFELFAEKEQLRRMYSTCLWFEYKHFMEELFKKLIIKMRNLIAVPHFDQKVARHGLQHLCSKLKRR